MEMEFENIVDLMSKSEMLGKTFLRMFTNEIAKLLPNTVWFISLDMNSIYLDVGSEQNHDLMVFIYKIIERVYGQNNNAIHGDCRLTKNIFDEDNEIIKLRPFVNNKDYLHFDMGSFTLCVHNEFSSESETRKYPFWIESNFMKSNMGWVEATERYNLDVRCPGSITIRDKFLKKFSKLESIVSKITLEKIID